jgi:hypothetical protein
VVRVDPPIGPTVIPTGWTYDSIPTTYGTYNALPSQFATYDALAAGPA